MNKIIWKYILNVKEMQELLLLCRNFTIQIPGFRNKSGPKNMERRIISLILQPENLKRLTIDKTVSRQDEYQVDEILSETNLEALQQLATNKYPPSKVLEVLLINKRFEDANNIFTFFNDHYSDHELYLLERDLKNNPKKQIKQETETKIEESEKDEANEIKVVKKLEGKIINLKEELDKAHHVNNKLKEDLSNEKKDKSNEMQQLKTENGNLQKTVGFLDKEITSLKKEMLEKDQREQSLKEIIKELENENKELKQDVVKDDDNEKNDEQLNITIVGKPSNSLVDSCKINFTVLDKSEVQITDLTNQDEIWVLTYQVDQKIKKELERLGLQKPIHLIRTFLELKQEIQRRINVHDKQSVGS